MEKMLAEDVVIVGGGIAGLATALGLKRVGIRSLVLERSHELRSAGAALTLAPNAWRALDALGVAHKLCSIYPPFTEVYVTDLGTGQLQRVSLPSERQEGFGLRPVHRKVLLEALADELSPEAIRFSSKLISITQNDNQHSSSVILRMDDGTVISAKVLIGCDGVNSVVAEWLGLSKPIHSGRVGVRGLSIYPEGHGFKHQVQQFVNGELRGGFLPLSSTDVFWFMLSKSCVKGGDETRRAPELIQKDVLENMAKNFPQVYLDVVQRTDLSTLTSAPLLFRNPLNLIFRPACEGVVTVAGDAMHPTTPDLGQGGCMALEDAIALSQHFGNLLIKDGHNIKTKGFKEALEGYANERRWRAASVITGSYLSGWVQQGGSSWWVKFIRDHIFYRFLFTWLSTISQFDCGNLPSVSSRSQDLY